MADERSASHRQRGLSIVNAAPAEDVYDTGDEVSGEFRCAECDLLIKSPRENDGLLVLPVCALCSAERWRRVG